LAEGAESAGLGKKLAAIVCDVPLKFVLQETFIDIIDWKNGVHYMRSRLGFKSIPEKIEKTYLKIVPPENPQLKLI
jgi:hypothetical protein